MRPRSRPRARTFAEARCLLVSAPLMRGDARRWLALVLVVGGVGWAAYPAIRGPSLAAERVRRASASPTAERPGQSRPSDAAARTRLEPHAESVVRAGWGAEV